MYIIRLSGGLGNQLFQYAFGKSLEYKSNSELLLDISSYDNQPDNEAKRTFSLNKFNIKAKVCNSEDIIRKGFVPANVRTGFRALKRKLRILTDSFRKIENRKYVIEDSFVFNPYITSGGRDQYYSGIWQSYKYFDDISEIIRQEISLTSPLSPEAQIIADNISKSRSAAIHVRRGDMANDPKLTSKHGLMSTEYYKRAMDIVERDCDITKYFVFSDDIAWTRDNIKFNRDTIFVSKPAIPDHEELILMSMCHNQIIANSTFSWWAGWLNRNTNKRVIAPSKWFNSDTRTDDLIPPEWIRIWFSPYFSENRSFREKDLVRLVS